MPLLCGLATRGPGDSVCKFSLFKKFRVLNFCGLLRPQIFFNNENFPIYVNTVMLLYMYVFCV